LLCAYEITGHIKPGDDPTEVTSGYLLWYNHIQLSRAEEEKKWKKEKG
jgi:hypothetical protein